MTTPADTDLATGVARALSWRPVLVAWLLAVGVDLFFNAGILSVLFDQSREPSLLPDAVLFRRVPVAYLGLAVGVAALAWLLDSTNTIGGVRGASVGALAGLTASLLGIVGLWTALEMTGAFVVAGALVQIVEFAAAGAALGSYRSQPRPRHLTGRIVGVAIALVLLGITAQNIMGTY